MFQFLISREYCIISKKEKAPKVIDESERLWFIFLKSLE